ARVLFSSSVSLTLFGGRSPQGICSVGCMHMTFHAERLGVRLVYECVPTTWLPRCLSALKSSTTSSGLRSSAAVLSECLVHVQRLPPTCFCFELRNPFKSEVEKCNKIGRTFRNK
ncbi:hypothetical protein KC19_1G119900, partial [Ceratodon purpureus]